MTGTSATERERGDPDRPRVANGDTYRLGHRWLIDGPIDVVFDLLRQARGYPTWWVPCFKSAESDDAEAVVGTRSHLRVRSQLPYELVWDITLVRADRPHTIEVDTIVRLSNRFPMRGPIRYRLTEVPGGVEVINEQLLVAERRLPPPLRAIAQRVFAYNHAWAFRVGGRGLQKAVDEAVAAGAAGPLVA